MASLHLSDLPDNAWAEFEARAEREGRPLRPLLLALMDHYAKYGLPPGVTSPLPSPVRTDDRVRFTLACGKGHAPMHEFDRKQFAAMLASGTLKLPCSWCGRSRLATLAEIRTLQRRLGHGTLHSDAAAE